MKRFLALLTFLFSLCASAQTTNSPITLTGTNQEPGGILSNPAMRLHWHGAPGINFCIAYATIHGAGITARLGGRIDSGDMQHCLSTDRNGNASDVIALAHFKGEGDGLLMANIVMIDDKVYTIVIPPEKLFFTITY
jgi:hypothetical protein